MKLNTLMVINTIVAGVFGVAFIAVPWAVLTVYGVQPSAQLLYVARLFGAALAAFAVMTWIARNAAASDARRAMVLGLAVGDAVGFVIALVAQLGGVVNTLGWFTVAIYFLLGVGFASFALRQAPQAPSAP
jgi:hypothetical protein